MNSPELDCVALHPRHDRSRFTTGRHPELATYLKTFASQDVKRNLARVFCLTRAGENEVLGYYSLSACSVAPAQLPPEHRRKLPKLRPVPAALLGRLAVASSAERQGFGGLLLADAVRRVREQDALAVHALLVDAKDETAAGFYRHFGFVEMPSNPLGLFLPLGAPRTS